MLWVMIGSVMAGGAVLLLRRGWERVDRYWPLLALAWGLLVLGILLAAVAEGAWGVAIASSIAMLAGLACLAVAVWRAPPDKARAAERRTPAPPDGGGALHPGRRIVTFLMVVPLALIVSTALALTARALVAISGGAEADANVATLFLTPLLWGILSFLLLMMVRRRTQWLTLMATASLGGLGVLLGMVR
ncbi:MAG: hypothetical protein ABW184_02520 [Sphingobium sp.]